MALHVLDPLPVEVKYIIIRKSKELSVDYDHDVYDNSNSRCVTFFAESTCVKVIATKRGSCAEGGCRQGGCGNVPRATKLDDLPR